MASRIVMFDADSLLKLITHYSEGQVPLDAEVVNILVSQRLQRILGLIVQSKDWDGTPFAGGDGYNKTQPFWFDYEGKRTQVVNHLQDPVYWNPEGHIEPPKRQM